MRFNPPLRATLSSLNAAGGFVHIDRPDLVKLAIRQTYPGEDTEFRAVFVDKHTKGPVPKRVAEGFKILSVVKDRKAVRILEVTN